MPTHFVAATGGRRAIHNGYPPAWGESVLLSGDNSAGFFMLAVDLGDEEARAAWRPFLDWVRRQPSALTSTVSIGTVPFGITWDARSRDQEAPDSICYDDRISRSAKPGAEGTQADPFGKKGFERR